MLEEVLGAIASALGVSLDEAGARASGHSDSTTVRGSRSRSASHRSSGVEDALEEVRKGTEGEDAEGEGAEGGEEGSTFAMLRRLYHTRQSDEARWARVAKELGDAFARARALQGTVERGVAAGAIGSAWGTGFGAGGRGDWGSRLSLWVANLCAPCFLGTEPVRARYAQVHGSSATPARSGAQRSAAAM